MRVVSWVACALAAMAAAGADDDAALRADVERHLRQGVLEVWFPRILDAEHGGFLCDFDAAWRPAGRQPKTIVYQARAVWTASKAAMRYGDDPRYRQAADHGFKFLRDAMWDAEHGGFHWALDRQGRPWPQSRGTKHAYGIAFGIYALAAHHEATKDPASLELAKRAFAWLDRVGHDGKHGGYLEYYTREGKVIETPADNPVGPGGANSSIGVRVGYKSMNAHIHILEGLTALYHVWPDETLKARLNEVFLIVRDKVVAPPGAMHQYFNRDWTPVPDVCSFGHDVETAFLLVEAAEALGMKDDARTWAVAKGLLDHALDFGVDAKNFGLFESGGTFGPVHDKRKVWWSQAEFLNALLLFSKRYPDDPRGYRTLFERQWAYVKKNVVDEKNGDWYQHGLDGADPTPDGAKASMWKAMYHNGRALMNVVDWLGERAREDRR